MNYSGTLKLVLPWIAVGVFSVLPTGAKDFSEPDAETELCLSEGKILKKLRDLDGVTRPEMFLIECGGEKRRVVVKKLDDQRRGIQRFHDGSWEMNYSDSYRYERAAYLLDRELGLDMVPVAVIREVKNKESGVLEWIDGASHVKQMPTSPTGPQMAELARQKAVMRIFDALIYNTDRNEKNYLIDHQSWKLYLIDHSRAFRSVGELPESFQRTTPRLSRDLYQRLQNLERDALIDLMDRSIDRGQIDKILERRDKILEKIDRACDEFGDEVIFSG
jgi:hypothetical protein